MASVPAAFAHDPSEDVARFVKMTPEQRLALCPELCELAESIQRHRPNADALRAPQPRSEESIALWERLMRGSLSG